MKTARDIVRAMMRFGPSLEALAEHLEMDELDLAEKVESQEVKALLQTVMNARRACDAAFAGDFTRSAIFNLHALSALHAAAGDDQSEDERALTPSERLRRAETSRKASVDLLRITASLTGGGSRDHPATSKERETPTQRREREAREAFERFASETAEMLGPDYVDECVRLDPLLRKHGMRHVPLNGAAPDMHHPFYAELKKTHPDLWEKHRDEAERHARDARGMKPFDSPEDVKRFLAEEAKTDAERSSEMNPNMQTDTAAPPDPPPHSTFPPGHPYGPPRSPP